MTTLRKAVPLTYEEYQAIEEVRLGPALADLAGPEAARSEAATLHALVRLGLERVREHAAQGGYAALAACQTDEDRAFAETVRSRRRSGLE